MKRCFKRFVGLNAVAVAALSSMWPVPAGAAPAGPRISFATNVYDFGRILSGEVVKHTYTLTNTGDEALEITRVTPSCHCTTAGDWTHHLQPGQAGHISVQFDSHSLHGEINKSITVASNDKKSPMQTLRLKGSVYEAIKIKPDFIFMTILPQAKNTPVSVVKLTDQLDQAIAIFNPASSNPALQVELKTNTEGREYELSIKAVGPFKEGRTDAIISAATSLTNLPEIHVQTYVTSLH